MVEDLSSDKDEVYTFTLGTKTTSRDKPLFRIKVHDTPITIMADSGASINVLDENDYCKIPSKPKLQSSSVKIYAYLSSQPLPVLGKFNTTLESETKKLSDKVYVVKGSGGSSLSWKTSQQLNLLQTVQQVTKQPTKSQSNEPTDLVREYDDLFHGLGKLKITRSSCTSMKIYCKLISHIEEYRSLFASS